MGTVVAVYLAVGLLIAIALFGWIAVSSVRRHGFRNAVRGAARTYVEELPRYWRVPVVGWMFVIALPVIAVWASVRGDWDPVGAVFVGLLCLLYLALLRWHYRAEARGRGTPRRRTVGSHSRTLAQATSRHDRGPSNVKHVAELDEGPACRPRSGRVSRALANKCHEGKSHLADASGDLPAAGSGERQPSCPEGASVALRLAPLDAGPERTRGAIDSLAANLEELARNAEAPPGQLHP